MSQQAAYLPTSMLWCYRNKFNVTTAIAHNDDSNGNYFWINRDLLLWHVFDQFWIAVCAIVFLARLKYRRKLSNLNHATYSPVWPDWAICYYLGDILNTPLEERAQKFSYILGNFWNDITFFHFGHYEGYFCLNNLVTLTPTFLQM